MHNTNKEHEEKEEDILKGGKKRNKKISSLRKIHQYMATSETIQETHIVIPRKSYISIESCYCRGPRVTFREVISTMQTSLRLS